MPRGRLLILDDDPTVGQILVFVAQSLDFEAQLIEAPQAFCDAALLTRPSHVAIDLFLGGGVSGLDVLRTLAAAGCEARVIVSSGAGAAELQAALLEAQALGLRTAGSLSKPFSIAALKALLADVPAAPYEGA